MYEFNNVRPPLMKDFRGDVLSIPENLLSRDLGVSTWVEQYPFKIPIDFLTNIRCYFTVTRRKYWQISEPPTRYAADLARSITITRGFTKTEREIIQKNSKIDFSAAGWGLSGAASQELNVTKETTFEWREEYSQVSNQTFLANNTYCMWSLVDRLDLTRVDKVHDDQIWQSTFKGAISCVLSVYQDRVSDDEIQAAPATISQYSEYALTNA